MTRLRGRPFGLRGRIVGVVLITAVATLVVAAVALLGPLEASLRNSELTTLRTQVLGNKGRAFDAFSDIPLNRVTDTNSVHRRLYNAQEQLGGKIDGVVAVIPAPGGAPLITPPRSDAGDAYPDATVAFRTGHDYSFAEIGDRQYARVAVRFMDIDHQYAVLAVRKDIGENAAVVRVVARAFFDAAMAGLVLTLILGIPLSGRLVRRLRRLRLAALELAHAGPTAEVPIDRAHDEVGDLARTLAVMQHRLRQQEEARRAFVATASHELRTPLTSLDGMLELLADDLRDDDPDLEDARALVDRAHAQSRRLGRLASDLLDLSRIDAQVALRSEPVELGELSRAVMAEFELGTGRHDVRSRLDEIPGAVWALGDPGSIAQILRILLDNAVRMSPPSTEIRIVLKRNGGVSISVCDEGPGVHPEERDSIFERFHRGRDTAGQAGFGLGLAIGRELAERMGGKLMLEDSPRQGAVFTLWLPAARAPEHDPLAVA